MQISTVNVYLDIFQNFGEPQHFSTNLRVQLVSNSFAMFFFDDLHNLRTHIVLARDANACGIQLNGPMYLPPLPRLILRGPRLALYESHLATHLERLALLQGLPLHAVRPT